MKILTGLIVVVYSVLIAVGLAQVARTAESIADLTQTLREQLRETLIQLRIWVPAYVFAFGAGLIEGFLWQRKQVFAGFYRTVLHLSVPVATALVLTAALVPVATAWREVLFAGMGGLSFALGLTLLAGRPLVR